MATSKSATKRRPAKRQKYVRPAVRSERLAANVYAGCSNPTCSQFPDCACASCGGCGGE